MSNITLDEWAPLLSREASARRGTLLAIFVVVALVFLITAWLWQKKYTSYVQLHVDTQNAVQTVSGVDSILELNQSNVARETLFGNDIMDKVLNEVGYVSADSSPAERELVKRELIRNTEIFNIDNQLLEIVVNNSDPKMAFETARLYADLFLAKTMANSTEETSGAFDFIVAQVESYRTKLEDAEARLESFKQQYPGVSTVKGGDVETRIVELRRSMEEANLQYAEFNQRRKSLERQLNSEAAILDSRFRNDQFKARIAGIQQQIDTLRLSYTDDYPEIISLKQQLESVRQGGPRPVAGASSLNPELQILRSNLSAVTAEAESQRTRGAQIKVQLEQEIKRSSVSSRVERELIELNRDYQINKELYEQLLRSRESAGLSMRLSDNKQGVLYRIQQQAIFPVLPTGLRFMHIAAAGLILALALPIVYLIVFLKLDPRIRTQSAVTDLLELPLLTTVPHLPQPGEKTRLLSRPASVVGVVMFVVALYILVAIAKYMLASQGAA